MCGENNTSLKYVIYLMTIADNRYVGLTNDFEARKRAHLRDLNRHEHVNGKMQKAYNEYGRTALSFAILERDVSQTEVDKREKYWIAQKKSYAGKYTNGLNLTRGGGGGHLPAQPILWNGVEYESISAASRATGIKDTTLKKYVEAGHVGDNISPTERERRARVIVAYQRLKRTYRRMRTYPEAYEAALQEYQEAWLQSIEGRTEEFDTDVD